MAETKTPAQLEAERKHQEELKRQQGQHPNPPKTASPARPGGATVGGAMSTYSSEQQVQAKPFDPKDYSFTFDEVKGMVGDIQRGEIGHIELDPEGKPTGAAFRDIPDRDTITAPVYGTPSVQFDELVTPSGAPITKHMNPEQNLWDSGMLARNPQPERKEQRGPVGGGVVNQPVAH